ncbi:MAG TPA: hypothetical protein VFK38_06025 [Candidatus Limnocylindrales bacterium]|nr:hypothetical protein [Candidatus Limnocylindrales bacterium]
MELSWLTRPMAFVHVLSVLIFLLMHGVSAAVAWRLRSERDRTRIRTLLELSGSFVDKGLAVFTVAFFSGILAGIFGGYWTSGRLWIWASLVLVIVVGGLMTPFGRLHLNAIRTAVGLPVGKDPPPATEASDEELARLLASPKPLLVITLGISGVVVLTWLMMAKPF